MSLLSKKQRIKMYKSLTGETSHEAITVEERLTAIEQKLDELIKKDEGVHKQIESHKAR